MTTEAKQARIDRREELMQRSREGFFRAVEWTERMGFKGERARFAASVASTMKVQKKRQLTKADVPAIEQGMRAQWPFLFEEEL